MTGKRAQMMCFMLFGPLVSVFIIITYYFTIYIYMCKVCIVTMAPTLAL